MKLSKIITGVALIICAIIIIVQFKFDSFIQALLGYADLGSTTGVLVAFSYLIAGTIYIVCSSSVSVFPAVVSFVLLLLGGIMGIFNALRFPGIMIWSWVAIAVGTIMVLANLAVKYFFSPEIDEDGSAHSNSYYDNNQATEAPETNNQPMQQPNYPNQPQANAQQPYPNNYQQPNFNNNQAAQTNYQQPAANPNEAFSAGNTMMHPQYANPNEAINSYNAPQPQQTQPTQPQPSQGDQFAATNNTTLHPQYNPSMSSNQAMPNTEQQQPPVPPQQPQPAPMPNPAEPQSYGVPQQPSPQMPPQPTPNNGGRRRFRTQNENNQVKNDYNYNSKY